MTSGHLDTTLLADYDEGLLAAEQVILVQEHLTRCETCSDILERLGEMRAQLGAAPAEIPIPAAVAARIDAALAVEQADHDLRSAQQRLATVHPLRRRLPRLLAAAAAVGAAAFGGYVVGTTSSGGDSVDSATSAQGAQDEAADGDEGVGSDAASGAESAPERTALPLPPQIQRSALTEQIRAIAAGTPAALQDGVEVQPQADDCGKELARELGREVIGAAPTDLGGPDAVLVVVDAVGTDLVQGFVLPTCAAGTAEAVAELTVAIE